MGDILIEKLIKKEITEAGYKVAMKNESLLGKRVEILDNYEKDIKGLKGVVVDIMGGGNNLAIQFDEDIDGHDCGGRCDYGYGWYVPFDNVKILKEE